MYSLMHYDILLCNFFHGTMRMTAHEVGVYDFEDLSRESLGLMASCRDYPCQSSADDIFCE